MHINDITYLFWGVFPGGQAFFNPFGANINVYTGATGSTICPNFFVLSFFIVFFIFLILLVLYSSSLYSSILIFKLLVFSYYSFLLLNSYLFISSSSSLLMPHPKWATRHPTKYNVPRPSQLRCSFWWIIYTENPAKIPVWQKICQSIPLLI